MPTAYKLKKGFIPVRKPGKLPYECVAQSYDLEYGSDSIEIHADAIEKGANIKIISFNAFLEMIGLSEDELDYYLNKEIKICQKEFY